MKQIAICCFLFTSFNGFSQDILVKISGDSIKVKILEIGLMEVKYKNYDDVDGITYGIYRSEVSMIRYQDGRVEKFDKKEEQENTDKNLSPEEKCRCGRVDAAKFHGFKGPACFIGGYCGPFALLGTALLKQTPRTGVRTMRDSEHKTLFNDPYYLKCYNQKAKSDLLNAELTGMLAVLAFSFGLVYLLNR